MDVLILSGSPRPKGNTAQLLSPFTEELTAAGAECQLLRLYDRRILPCTGCRTCQRDWTVFGCPQPDDVQLLFDRILTCDLLVLATPIHSWYCTPPMKALLDRLVYGMNKYYGTEKGPALWQGKPVALVTTCGYPPEKGADLWETGMRRYCKHSRLRYLGQLCAHDPGYGTVFMDEEKAVRARAFARTLLTQV